MKDYKTGGMKIHRNSGRMPFLFLSGLAIALISAWLILPGNKNNTPEIIANNITEPVPTSIREEIPTTSIVDVVAPPSLIQTENIIEVESDFETEITVSIDEDLTQIIAHPEVSAISTEPEEEWQSIKVKSGDSLALIFSRLGLSPNELYNIMSLGKEVSKLKRIRPGQALNFLFDDDGLNALEYDIDLTNTLKVTKEDGKFSSRLIHQELESVVKDASAIIKDSLFLSGKRAGLSDNLIMQLVSIYGWDIDFALDIREGDSFTVIYEEQYKDGVKVSDGPIIAAEFVNRNEPLRAIRYKHDDGRVDYYADNGDAMRKAFLRTPVEFARISSRFNLKRKHPILNKIRAHRGVDYAAATGTPIKATGDGTVIHAGKKGGYGRTVILKHGGKYSTLYAHLHRYAKGVRSGKRVKQGQIIGYVGKSGLATGPHLHYEFRVNGVHRNPLTVKLPKVESISKKILPEFRKTITPMLAELDRLTGQSVLAAQTDIGNKTKLAMEDG